MPENTSLRIGERSEWCTYPRSEARKRSEALPKSNRPLILTSFILKTREKLVGKSIRDEALLHHPLHKHQYTHQLRRSTTHTYIAILSEQDIKMYRK